MSRNKDAPLIRVAIMEPYGILREGLSSIVQGLKGLCLVGEFGSLSEFAGWFKAQAVDVVIIGYHVRSVLSMNWMRVFPRAGEGVAVLVFNGFGHPRHAQAAMDQGARGVIDLRSSPLQLEAAIRCLAAGGRYVAGLQSGRVKSSLPELSHREFDVLMLTAMGFRLKEIAERLGVISQTAYSYRAWLRDKLGLKSASDLVRFACEHGLMGSEVAEWPVTTNRRGRTAGKKRRAS